MVDKLYELEDRVHHWIRTSLTKRWMRRENKRRRNG